MAGDVRVLAWITEGGWEACVDAVRALGGGEVTLLYVASVDLPGPRGPRHERVMERMAALAGEAASALLEDAQERLGVAARMVTVDGDPATAVMEAAADADVLVLTRDGRHPGPHSLGHAARFVVDHAPCTVVLAWPPGGPDGPPPKPKPKGKPKPKPPPHDHW